MERRGVDQKLELCPAGEKPFSWVLARCQKFGVPRRFFSTCKWGFISPSKLEIGITCKHILVV